MKNRKEKGSWWMILCILFLLCGIIFYFGEDRDNKKKISFMPKVIDENNDFWCVLIDGAKVAAEEYGVELNIVAPDREDDVEMQLELLEEEKKKKPDAIIISPIDYTELTDSIEDARKKGIRVILVDSMTDRPVENALIATNNIEAGKKMGQYLKENMPENPVIGIVAHVKGASTAIEREQGFRMALGEEYENCIIGTVFTDSDYEKGYQVTRELLAEHPDVNVLVGLNEYSAVGAARAVRSLGREKNILMIGFDSSIEEIQLLESGVFKAIVTQRPFNMGYLGVETAVNIINKKKVDKNLDSGSVLITKETMNNFENQKLLFPFREKME